MQFDRKEKKIVKWKHNLYFEPSETSHSVIVKALMTDGTIKDIEMYNETLEAFLTESEDRLPKMDNFLKEKDAANYAILAHAMKSDSKYLGFKKLAELSLNHELEGKNNNVEYLENNYEELMAEVDRIIDIVKKYLGGK